MKQLKKRLLAALTAVVMLASVTAAIAPVKAVESADALSKYVDLEGEWHFKLYRTYEKMYQYFAYSPALSLGKWTDAEAAVYPEDGAWNSWETFDFPADNPETGGLLTNDIFPTWSEAWAVREFEVPADFTDDETVTLLMGIIDDNDVVYINGKPVAASGFTDGNGEPVHLEAFPETGGFVYEIPKPPSEGTASATDVKSEPNPVTVLEATPDPAPEATPDPTPEATPDPTPEATPDPTPEATPDPAPEATPDPAPEATPDPTPEATPDPAPEEAPEPTPEVAPETSEGLAVYAAQPSKEEQVRWEKSYWEIEREYQIPAAILQEGTNEIAIRIYNNNSFGGFYSGHVYALCGNEQAVRHLKGLPTEAVASPEILEAIEAQNRALAEGDIEAYAATISENYHNDAAVKADRVAEMQTLLDGNGNLTVTDSGAKVYKDASNNLWYSAIRTVSGSKGEIASASGAVEICFAVSNGTALERGNWNRCYGDSYHSELFGKNLSYSVYLPPSYYENTNQNYPTVWLLHGRGSSSTSYRNVDNIGGFMDEQIEAGNIMEMVLVMPDSGKTAFYSDSTFDSSNADGTGPWRTQLTDELRREAESKYRLMKDPAFRGLSGNSMGAYGSIMAGLTHPELYSSIGLHMGYLPAEALETLKGVSLETLASYDFYMDAGKQDTTVGTAGTVAIHDYLESIDKEHGYSIRDGGHNSAFYMAGMPASMKMHSDHFQTAIDEGHVTIFFDANGGTASKSFMGTVGGKLTALPAASRSGYNFNGWYTAASGGEKVDLNKVYEETATLYAQWTKITSGGGSSSGGSGGGSSSGGTSRPSTAKPGTSKPESNKPSTEANDSQQSGPVFNDVPESFWANKEIAWASENGIMNGMGGDRFAPNDTVSRQQLWMVLGRLAGAAPSDMAAASDWAKENGVSDGTMPGGNVSRQQLVAMLYRYAKLQGVSVDTLANISSYPDSGSVANYAKDALAWAIANGIINGTSDGRLNPEGTATRAQFAVIMFRFEQKFGK